MLVSVNPFKQLGIYTDEILQQYASQSISDLPPHIFAISRNALDSFALGLCFFDSLF